MSPPSHSESLSLRNLIASHIRVCLCVCVCVLLSPFQACGSVALITVSVAQPWPLLPKPPAPPPSPATFSCTLSAGTCLAEMFHVRAVAQQSCFWVRFLRLVRVSQVPRVGAGLSSSAVQTARFVCPPSLVGTWVAAPSGLPGTLQGHLACKCLSPCFQVLATAVRGLALTCASSTAGFLRSRRPGPSVQHWLQRFLISPVC